MRRSLRLVAVVLALCISASVGTVGVINAGAAVAKSSVYCGKLSGSQVTAVTISECRPSGGPGYATASQPFVGAGVLTWSSSGATTTFGPGNFTLVGVGGCKNGFVEWQWTSTVVAASTSGPGIPAVGDAASATWCMYYNYHLREFTKVTILPGTKVHL